jgi:hypothetical protein
LIDESAQTEAAPQKKPVTEAGKPAADNGPAPQYFPANK